MVRYKATEEQPASAVKVINVSPLRLPPSGVYRTSSTIYGLRPGLAYELNVKDRIWPTNNYYTGIVSSDGTCPARIYCETATYKIRYRPQNGLDYSPWVVVSKQQE